MTDCSQLPQTTASLVILSGMLVLLEERDPGFTRRLAMVVAEDPEDLMSGKVVPICAARRPSDWPRAIRRQAETWARRAAGLMVCSAPQRERQVLKTGSED